MPCRAIKWGLSEKRWGPSEKHWRWKQGAPDSAMTGRGDGRTAGSSSGTRQQSWARAVWAARASPSWRKELQMPGLGLSYYRLWGPNPPDILQKCGQLDAPRWRKELHQVPGLSSVQLMSELIFFGMCIWWQTSGLFDNSYPLTLTYLNSFFSSGCEKFQISPHERCDIWNLSTAVQVMTFCPRMKYRSIFDFPPLEGPPEIFSIHWGQSASPESRLVYSGDAQECPMASTSLRDPHVESSLSTLFLETSFNLPFIYAHSMHIAHTTHLITDMHVLSNALLDVWILENYVFKTPSKYVTPHQRK